eukprot:scaffold56013_cov67-Phaeocystis_antarctica.AAC.1
MPCKCVFGVNVPCSCRNVCLGICCCVGPLVHCQNCCPCDGCFTKCCCEAAECYARDLSGASGAKTVVVQGGAPDTDEMAR